MIRRLLPEALTLVIAVTLAMIVRAAGGLAGYTLVVIDGVSMEPLFHTGDIVLVKRVKPDEIHVNDIIVYVGCDGRLIIHRVYYKCVVNGVACYVTWGDNNLAPDITSTMCTGYACQTPLGKGTPCVPHNRVIGKVVEVNGMVYKIPYFGILALIARGG